MDSVIPILEDSLTNDPAPEVQETCELALRRIKEQKSLNSVDGTSPINASPFLSVDPAVPTSLISSVDQLRYNITSLVLELLIGFHLAQLPFCSCLREVLLNEEEGMYERYAALFALRNDGRDAAVSAIISSLGARSALLRHEVCQLSVDTNRLVLFVYEDYVFCMMIIHN